ncbi:hypothetical protein [uncultured Martelella sp.]|uniref:hypothetical protein n=1 Tax=uncultured Martelella sp. TaxID=392331 RepID=UPI0029C84E17|nr:hypothetical protein [uncultured Martelella sp.]
MFEHKTSPGDLLDRLRFSQQTPVERAGSVVRGEVNALSKTARQHPAASGSALALVGLVAFGLGFLAGNASSSEAPAPRKRIFRSRRRSGKPFSSKRSSFFFDRKR